MRRLKHKRLTHGGTLWLCIENGFWSTMGERTYLRVIQPATGGWLGQVVAYRTADKPVIIDVTGTERTMLGAMSRAMHNATQLGIRY